MYRRILLLLSLVLLTACATATEPPPTLTPTLPVTSTSTLTPAPSSTSTPAFTPTPTPLPADGVQTICLKVTVESESKLSNGVKDLQRIISEILGDLDVQVVGPNDACQAHLAVEVALAGSSDEYLDEDSGNWVTCFTGQSAHGEISFEPPRGEALTFPINKDIKPYQGTITVCPKTEDDVFFVQSWGDGLLLAFRNLWGYRAMVPFILGGFVRGHPHLSFKAVEILEAAGPKAMSAVPDLIDLLSMVHGDPMLSGGITQALEGITGQDFGNDPEAWRSWWKEES